MRLFPIVAALLLTGCATSIMKGYIGKPLQSAMVQYGPPQNAFDMPDGRRAFQWNMESTYVTPTQVNNQGTAYPIGSALHWSQNTQITGGVPITSKCTYTLYGRWSEPASAWIIEGFEKPKFLCE